MRAVFFLVVAVSVGFSSAAGAQLSVEFPLHTFGTTRSRVVIETDEEILVPSLSSVPLTRENVARVIPYLSSEQGQALFKELIGRPNLTLGHASVYFYIAVSLAIDRIYRSALLGQNSDRSQAEKDFIKGLEETYQGTPNKDKLLVSLRDLAGIKPIKDAVLHVKVFFSADRFSEAAASAGLHAAQAFWDPTTSTFGLYFDKKVFNWYRSRATVGDSRSGEAATHVRDYVAKQLLDRIAHELIHFIHTSNGDFLGHRPFLAEGIALLIQSNISVRDDIGRIGQESRVRGLSEMPPPGSPCLALFKASPPMYSSSLVQFMDGLEAARKGIALEEILLLGPEQFYSQRPDALKAQYDAALAFSLFASSLARERFETLFMPLMSKGETIDIAALKALGADFQRWADDRAAEWWMSKDVDAAFDSVQKLTVACFDNKDYVLAYIGSQLLLTLRPSSVMPFLHAGDVFKNLDMPFFAFDFYARSKAQRKGAVRREFEDQLDVRLGDVLIQLGDIQEALKWYSSIASVKPASVLPESAFDWFESRLKIDFYEHALRAGYARDKIGQALAASYVDEFYEVSCVAEDDSGHIKAAVQAIASNDLDTMWNTLDARYRTVLSRVHEDRTHGTLDDIAAARREYCEDRE